MLALLLLITLQACTLSLPESSNGGRSGDAPISALESSDLPAIADGPAVNQSAYGKDDLKNWIEICRLNLPKADNKLKVMDDLAGWLYSDCQYKEAIAVCDRMLALKPDSTDAYYWKSLSYLRQSQFRQALESIQKANAVGHKNKYPNVEMNIKHQEYDYEHRESDPARRWALACTAILFGGNGMGLNSLTGADPSSNHALEERASLISWWRIVNRTALLEQLETLVEDGHSASWQLARKKVKNTLKVDAFTSDRRNSLEDRHALQLVDRYGNDFGKRGLYAWDYCRYISLCRWGAEVGFITPDEAWTLIMPVAAKIQKLYSSWEQVGGEYLIGRDFWSHSQYEEGREHYATLINWLLKTPASPWVQLPWDTDLKCKGDDATIYAAIEEVKNHRLPSDK
jgi:tetratricopeptide (TPR) repeat protein